MRGDYVATLAMARSLKGTSPTLKVARELTVEFAAASYTPAVVEHILGAAEVWLDVLSRKVPRPSRLRFMFDPTWTRK